ncbi:MAG: hypothetical protein ABJK20_08570, partial [Halieaceae bacterium]
STTELGNMENYYFGTSNSMADMYEKISFGQLMINGQVAGAINVSQTADQVCGNPFNYASSWLTQAENELGINRNDYRHRIFAIPRNLTGADSCGWTGYANVGCGSACTAFNRWSHDRNTTAHEFGHNLGMGHAGVGSNQYADYSSFMGYSLSNGVRALDGAHHWQTGWYDSIDALSTGTIQSSGTYDVAPLREISPADNVPSIYRIEVDSGDPYFLSARVAQGYDTDLSSRNSAALSGVNIHRYAGSGSSQTDRVDQLSNGGSYIDSLNSLTITQLSRAEDGTVTFSVDMGEVECVESTPALSINPQFQTVGPGGSYNFPVTVTNNDSTSCAARAFSLAATTGGELAPVSLSVNPGSQGSSSLNINGGSSSGETIVTVSIQGESTPSRQATLAVDAKAPGIGNLAGTYTRKGKNHRVQLSWSGSDESGIESYEIYRNGSPQASTGQSSYTDSLPRSPEATYTYYVRAFDVHGNWADSAIITVSTAGSTDGDDGGGGGGNDKPCRGKNCDR